LLRTFSKIYGLAGLRLGYGIGHRDLIAALEKIRQPFNVNSMAQAGGLAALDDEEHVRKTRQNNLEGRKFFEETLRAMSVEFVPSHANFILARVGDGRGVFAALQAGGIIVRPMEGYGLPEWIRISIGTPRENQRCAKALKKILGKKQNL
jgi:histidinol-phosphate aminotransferase